MPTAKTTNINNFIQEDINKIIIFDSSNSTNPRVFHEQYTNTNSWILLGKNISLPESGIYFLVSFSPNQKPGKMWVSIGRQESFSGSDLARLPTILPKIKSFHQKNQIQETPEQNEKPSKLKT